MAPAHFAFSAAFMLGLAGLTFHRAHLLSALLCLEGMMLSLYVGLSLWSLCLDNNSFSAAPMIFLALSACGASAGLSLLVATIRTHGTDLLQNLSLLQC